VLGFTGDCREALEPRAEEMDSGELRYEIILRGCVISHMLHDSPCRQQPNMQSLGQRGREGVPTGLRQTRQRKCIRSSLVACCTVLSRRERSVGWNKLEVAVMHVALLSRVRIESNLYEQQASNGACLDTLRSSRWRVMVWVGWRDVVVSCEITGTLNHVAVKHSLQRKQRFNVGSAFAR
jgi:hypothetical protein